MVARASQPWASRRNPFGIHLSVARMDSHAFAFYFSIHTRSKRWPESTFRIGPFSPGCGQRRSEYCRRGKTSVRGGEGEDIQVGLE